MARYSRLGTILGIVLASCSPRAIVKFHSDTIVLNPDVDNTFERCKVECELSKMGPPKACVETVDSYKCFCTPKDGAM